MDSGVLEVGNADKSSKSFKLLERVEPRRKMTQNAPREILQRRDSPRIASRLGLFPNLSIPILKIRTAHTYRISSPDVGPCSI
jgi:hypothetical protein